MAKRIRSLSLFACLLATPVLAAPATITQAGPETAQGGTIVDIRDLAAVLPDLYATSPGRIGAQMCQNLAPTASEFGGMFDQPLLSEPAYLSLPPGFLDSMLSYKISTDYGSVGIQKFNRPQP